MNHGTFSDGPFTRTEDAFVIRPPWLGACIHRLFVGQDGVDLRIRPDGFQHGNMWGLTQLKWHEVSTFEIDYLGIKYTRRSDGAARMIPEWYLGYGMVESLQVMLNGYRLAALAAPGGAPDDEVVREANQMALGTGSLMQKNQVSYLQMEAVRLGVVGRHRPHLLPEVGHLGFAVLDPAAKELPPAQHSVAAIEAALAAVQPNPLWPMHPLFDAFDWSRTNFGAFRPSLLAELEEHYKMRRELRASMRK